MSEIRVNKLINNGNNIDAPYGFRVEGEQVFCDYTQGTTQPSSAMEAGVFHNTDTEATSFYLSGQWRSVNLTAPVTDWTFTYSNLSYDNVSQSFSGTMGGQVNGLDFNSDGTKIYLGCIGSSGTGKISEFDLSTAYDPTTAGSEVNSLNTGAVDSLLSDFNFTHNGTQLWVSGRNNNSQMWGYTLSTAYDLSTATQTSNTTSAISYDQGGLTGFRWHNDNSADGEGKRIVGVGYNGDDLRDAFEYATAYDLDGTRTYDNRESYIGTQMTVSGSFITDTYGEKFYVCDLSNGRLHQYTFATAWDVSSTKTHNGYKDISSQTTRPTGIKASHDGTKLFIADRDSKTVFRYSTGI